MTMSVFGDVWKGTDLAFNNTRSKVILNGYRIYNYSFPNNVKKSK